MPTVSYNHRPGCSFITTLQTLHRWYIHNNTQEDHANVIACLVTEGNPILQGCHENRDNEVPSPLQEGRQAARALPEDTAVLLYELFVSVIVPVCVLRVKSWTERMCETMASLLLTADSMDAWLRVKPWPQQVCVVRTLTRC